MRSDRATKVFVKLMVAASLLIGAMFVSLRWVSDLSIASAVLHESPYVILSRHADAPGRGEPEGFALDDCRTQRNLSDKGRTDARGTGRLFEAEGIKVTKVIASRWCRAQETAALMNLGPVEDAPAFDNLEFNKDHAAKLLADERELISSWHGPGVLLIVTHNSNIKALTGIDPRQSAMLVVDPRQGRLLTKPFTLPSVADVDRCADCAQLSSLD